jgi:crotonobetainyl-CoA:carnitine CoA-transferase CaiB-like acyl-CoA transferase
MALTGFPGGATSLAPAGAFALLGSVADQLAMVTRAVGREVRADPAELLTIRSGLGGLTRQGQVSIGGLARLVRTADGWCAVTLSRDSDFVAVPAILGVLGADVAGFPGLAGEVPDGSAAWSAIEAVARVSPASELAEAAQLLGVAAAALAERPTPESAPWPPWRTRRIAEAFPAAPSPAGLPPAARPSDSPPAGPPADSSATVPLTASPAGRLDGAVVADLSTMWAGPLCARLLGLAGARVIKVEAPDRLDGVREGVAGFYDLLHAGHESLVVDFRTADGRAALASLLAEADVVIEASRPRALQSLGLAPEMTRHRPGQVWLSITGYGRDNGQLVAFGHDAAVAGGLVGWAGPAGRGGPRGASGTADKAECEPVFCADAVADPLTGVAGALAVARSIEAGGGELIDLPMSGVAACFAAAGIPDHGEHEVRDDGTVFCQALGIAQPILPPRVPERTWGRAADPGADNESVLSWLIPMNHPCH